MGWQRLVHDWPARFAVYDRPACLLPLHPKRTVPVAVSVPGFARFSPQCGGLSLRRRPTFSITSAHLPALRFLPGPGAG